MRRSLVITVLLASATIGTNGQEATTQLNAPDVLPKTRLEAVLATKGRLVVADFYQLGWFVVGEGVGRMTFDATVATEPGREERRTRGLRIEVVEAGRLSRPDTSFLDLEEVEGLSKALAHMIELAARWKDTEKQEYTEVQFATKGDFLIGFHQQKRDQRGFMSSGFVGATRVSIDVLDFAKVKGLLDQGVTLLQGK